LEPRSVGRKLAAIFVADVEGHSRLIGRDEVGTLRTLTAYRVTVDRLIVFHRGRLFKTTGDGYQVPQPGGCVARCRVGTTEALVSSGSARSRNGVRVRLARTL
jgi:class 3 adenylate cyclase